MSVFYLTEDLSIRRSPSRGKPSRKNPRAILICESFEDRIVLSHMGARPYALEGSLAEQRQVGSMSHAAQRGTDLSGALRELGIMFTGMPGDSGGRAGKVDRILATTTDETLKTLLTNLKTATEKLTTDLKTVVAKSEVTVAEVSALMTDLKTIRDAGVTLDPAAVKTVIHDLAYAVANGSDLTESKTAFAALFEGSTVSQETIDKTFEDLVKVIDHSNVSAEDLDLIAADKAAVEAAKAALTKAGYDHSNPKPKPSTGIGGIGGIGKARRFRRWH